MNKRKLIFAIIWVVILIIILIWVLLIKSSTTVNNTKSSSWNVKIWIIHDSKKSFEEYLTSFKEANKSFYNVNFIVESFPDFEEYSLALKSAFLKWEAPDIFMLNNNEKSIFEEKIIAIPNEIVDTNEFKKNYKWIFWDDLIISSENEKWEKVDFLKWMPFWYETLWVFYNRIFLFKPSDFNTMASLNNAIGIVAERKWVPPIWLWNWTTVESSPDILAQFFMINWVKWLNDVPENKIKETLSSYMMFWIESGENKYNSLYQKSIETGKNNIDLFANRDVGAIVGYPRIVKKLESSWFPKNMLYAEPFPHYYSWDWASLANYNYFVVNKDSLAKDLAFAFIKYLNTDEWEKLLLDKFGYYLPARLSLESEYLKKKVSWYFDNVILQDFYSEDQIASFNKINKILFDSEMKNVLDDFSSYENTFKKIKEEISCLSEKELNLKWLGESCK